MACKVNLEVSQFGGRDINLERFAYDVFYHSALKFGAHEVCFSRRVGAENKYARPDFIKVLSRMIFKYQITQRMTWCCLFYVRYFITNFKSFEDIQDASQMVLKLSKEDANGCLSQEVFISLAIMCELVRYLYDVSSGIYMEDLASVWTEHFCRIRKKFEEVGGFTAMYNRLNQPKYESLDLFYNEFIPKFCSLYDDPDVYPRLDEIFYQESSKYYERIVKNLSVEEQHEYNVVFSATIFRYSRPVMSAKDILRLGLPLEMKDFATEIPKWITSIRSPEYIEIGDGVTSHQNLATASRKEVERECIGSPTQVEGIKSEFSLGSFLGDFAKLNLGASKTERSDKPENPSIGIQLPKESLRDTSVTVADVATSSHNPPGASCQEMARETRGSPTQAESLTTKSSSSSTREDFVPLDLVCYEIEPRRRRPHGSGLRKEVFDECHIESFFTSHTERVATVHTNRSFRNHLLYSWYGEDVVTAFRNHRASSSLKEAGQRTGSSSQVERRRKRKSTSISSDEGIKQLNLGPLKREQSSEPGNIELAIGLAEVNDIAAYSSQPTGSSSQVEGRKRKPISSEEGNKQLNLGPSEAKQSSEPRNTELAIQLDEIHKPKEKEILWKSKIFMEYLLRFDLHNRAEDPDECAKFDEVLRKNALLADEDTPLLWHPPDTSSLEETRDKKRSSSQVEGEKKKSRLLSTEDFEQPNL